MSASGGAKYRAASSAVFRQLLGALQAEHERQIALLVDEVEHLRVEKDALREPSRKEDDFNTLVPCMPLMGILNSRPRTAQCLPRLATLVPSGQDEDLVVPHQSVSVVQFSQARDANGISKASTNVQDGTDAKEHRGEGRGKEASPEQLQADIVTDGKNGIVMKKHTQVRVNDTSMWPIWEGLHTSRPIDQSPTRVQEVLRKRSSFRVGATALRRTGSSKKVAKKKRWFPELPLDPTSKVKMAWDLCAPVALLYDFIVIPLQVFQIGESLTRKAVESLLLLYWFFDIVVSFVSGYYDDRGEPIRDFRRIANKYFRSWFFPDVIITGFDIITTSISWAWAANDADTSHNVDIARMGKFLRIARMARTLRFVRIAKLREVIYGVQAHLDSEAVSIAWGLCLNIFTLLVLNHITACLWYLIGSEGGQEFTWLKVPFQGGRTWAEAGIVDKYFVSLHWSLTLFTPASMSVQPENLHERIYAVVCLMLAMVVFASFVSTVTAGMTRLRNIQTENLEQNYKLRKFLRENQISTDLVARVMRYVEIAMKSNKKRVPKEAVVRLKWLSHPLHMELLWELNAPLLHTHPFFDDYGACSVSATRQLCFSAIKTVAISMRDSLFTSHMEATCMYFVRSGLLVYKRASGLNFPNRVCLEEKDHFVEHVLWLKWVHRGTMKAVTESSLMAVDSGKFREVSLAHPDVLVMAAHYAASFAEQVQGQDSCDVPQPVFDRREMRAHTAGGYLDAAEADTVFSSESDNEGRSGAGPK